MRRTGRHAVTAVFEPADDRVRGVLTRGAPLSSPARLVGRGVPGPAPSAVSLLLEACDPSRYDGRVRVELLAHPERTGALLEGVEFELLAGRGPLGCGRVLPEPPAGADPPAHAPGRQSTSGGVQGPEEEGPGDGLRRPSGAAKRIA